jgi:protein-S-isoprenylcysteine O-methyltransferase Ste14
MLGLAELIVIAIVAVPSVVLARLDARRQRFRPLQRAGAIAATFVGLLATLAIVHFLVGQARSPGVVYSLEVAWGTVLFTLLLMFAFVSLLSVVCYLAGHFLTKKRNLEPNDSDAEPTVHVEETGNPYQPPLR